MDRITAIRQSLTAFVCGIFGFLPILGIVPAVYALFCWARIRSRFRDEWNPASNYLSWGARLATFGLLGSILLLTIAIMTFVFHQFY